MEAEVMVAIQVPLVGDERRKNWAKIVTNVDQDRGDGWAYEGDFIAVGGIQDVMAPSVLLIYGEKGSRTNPLIEARVYTVNTDATLTLHESATGRAWARTLRDPVAELVGRDKPIIGGSKPWDPALMGYSDDALEHEVQRRLRRQDPE
jgi:hypothetical protein